MQYKRVTLLLLLASTWMSLPVLAESKQRRVEQSESNKQGIADKYSTVQPSNMAEQTVYSGSSTNNSAYSRLGRDPFAVTSSMLRMESLADQDIQFTQIEDTVVPKMWLRGMIDKNNNDETAALLEIDGIGMFVVREGDTIGLQQIGSQHVLHIEKITNLSLFVKAGVMEQRFIIR